MTFIYGENSNHSTCLVIEHLEFVKLNSNWINGSFLFSAWKSSIRRFLSTEKAPTRAFSWLKAATTAFTFKTLLRHYAKQALIPRWRRRKGHRRLLSAFNQQKGAFFVIVKSSGTFVWSSSESTINSKCSPRGGHRGHCGPQLSSGEQFVECITLIRLIQGSGGGIWYKEEHMTPLYISTTQVFGNQ